VICKVGREFAIDTHLVGVEAHNYDRSEAIAKDQIINRGNDLKQAEDHGCQLANHKESHCTHSCDPKALSAAFMPAIRNEHL